jgi:hypothetical protein
MTSVWRDICLWFGWRFSTVRGLEAEPSANCDVAVFLHSRGELVELQRRAFRGIHVRRDPREVVVSGYLYHRHTNEKWCVAKSTPDENPAESPRVPLSRRHESFEWKEKYLGELGELSYQQVLNRLPQNDGLRFEISHYGGWTIDHMVEVGRSRRVQHQVKIEDLLAGYDATLGALFSSLGFTTVQQCAAMRVDRSHDIGRWSADRREKSTHVHNPRQDRWRQYLDAELTAELEARSPRAITELGYLET